MNQCCSRWSSLIIREEKMTFRERVDRVDLLSTDSPIQTEFVEFCSVCGRTPNATWRLKTTLNWRASGVDEQEEEEEERCHPLHIPFHKIVFPVDQSRHLFHQLLSSYEQPITNGSSSCSNIIRDRCLQKHNNSSTSAYMYNIVSIQLNRSRTKELLHLEKRNLQQEVAL